MRLQDIETPAAILDGRKLEANLKRMHTAVARHPGVTLRPHLKTCKSVEVARRMLADPLARGATVATLDEAFYFAGEGITDLTWAVCVAPNKLVRTVELVCSGVLVRLLVDSTAGVAALCEMADTVRAAGSGPVAVVIEIDCGEHRTGVPPDDDALLETARGITGAAGLDFRGLLTHAGHAYACRDEASIRAVAEQERRAVVSAAERLRGAGIQVKEVSVGSTPTALWAENLAGVTEVRAGVYVFGDLFQASIGSLARSEIALSVLATVVHHDRPGHRFVIDAGGLALSKDRSTANSALDLGYGLVVGSDGQPLPNTSALDGDESAGGRPVVVAVHQEHGEVVYPSGADVSLAVGDLVRVLPNHACMTAAMYDRYYVVDESLEIEHEWTKLVGC